MVSAQCRATGTSNSLLVSAVHTSVNTPRNPPFAGSRIGAATVVSVPQLRASTY